MINEATPYLFFAGQCSSAIDLYKTALDAVVEDRRPWDPAMFGGTLPDSMKDGVMYARLKMGNVPLELSDAPESMPAVPGTNVAVNLHISDPDELDRRFALLAEGGTVQESPANTFWGARFGTLTDRFGIHWMLHCQLPE